MERVKMYNDEDQRSLRQFYSKNPIDFFKMALNARGEPTEKSYLLSKILCRPIISNTKDGGYVCTYGLRPKKPNSD